MNMSGAEVVSPLDIYFSAHPPHSKASLLTLGCGGGKVQHLLQGTQQSPGQLVLKKPKLLDAFQESPLKAR